MDIERQFPSLSFDVRKRARELFAAAAVAVDDTAFTTAMQQLQDTASDVYEHLQRSDAATWAQSKARHRTFGLTTMKQSGARFD